MKMYNFLILFLYFIYRLLCLLEEILNISIAAQLSQLLQYLTIVKMNRTSYQTVSYL